MKLFSTEAVSMFATYDHFVTFRYIPVDTYQILIDSSAYFICASSPFAAIDCLEMKEKIQSIL